jgi:hypothetical protein
MIFNLFVYHFHVNDFLKIKVLKNYKRNENQRNKKFGENSNN